MPCLLRLKALSKAKNKFKKFEIACVWGRGDVNIHNGHRHHHGVILTKNIILLLELRLAILSITLNLENFFGLFRYGAL